MFPCVNSNPLKDSSNCSCTNFFPGSGENHQRCQSVNPTQKTKAANIIIIVTGCLTNKCSFFFQIFYFIEQTKLQRKCKSNSKNKTVSNNRWFFKWIFQHQLYRIKCHLIFKYFVLKYTCLNKLKVKADRSRELIKSMPAERLIKIQFHFQMDIASFNQL